MRTQFHRLVESERLPDGEARGYVVNGWPVLVARTGGTLHAVIDRCPHAASDLASGRLRRSAIMCPLHGARFDLATGRCIGGVYSALRLFPIREHNGWVEVGIPEAPPSKDQSPVVPGTADS